MPYKKPYGYKRSYKRKPNTRSQFKKFGSRAGGAAHTALKIAMRLKDMVNTEYKFLDTNYSNTMDYNGIVSTLNSISQGITDTGRTGDSVKIQNIMLRGNILAGTVPAQLRVILFWDAQNKVASVSDVLESTGTAYSVLSPKNYDKRFQTKVLWDKVFDVVPTADNAHRHFQLSLPINLHSQYAAATSTINTGALKILLISNIVTTGLPTIVYYSRVSYTDN